MSTQTAWSGQPQRLLVLDAAARGGRHWVKVLLPVRPNGSAGWVLRDNVVLSRTRYWVDVRTGARVVTVYRDGRRVRRFSAVVGAPGTPTPHGLAAIYERNRQPNPRGFIGPWALPLTALSNVLENRLHPHRQPPDLMDGHSDPARHACAPPTVIAGLMLVATRQIFAYGST